MSFLESDEEVGKSPWVIYDIYFEKKFQKLGQAYIRLLIEFVQKIP